MAHFNLFLYKVRISLDIKISKISYCKIRIPFDKRMFRLGAAGDSSYSVAGDG